MGLLFAMALLCIPLAYAIWDLSRSGPLLPSRQRDVERRETSSAGGTREDPPAMTGTAPMASPSP
jgi:hypothetical protein